MAEHVGLPVVKLVRSPARVAAVGETRMLSADDIWVASAAPMRSESSVQRPSDRLGERRMERERGGREREQFQWRAARNQYEAKQSNGGDALKLLDVGRGERAHVTEPIPHVTTTSRVVED
jgi:hypothetical protein